MGVIRFLVPELQLAGIIKHYGFMAPKPAPYVPLTRQQAAAAGTHWQAAAFSYHGHGQRPVHHPVHPPAAYAPAAPPPAPKGANSEETWRKARKEIANLHGEGIRRIEREIEQMRESAHQGIRPAGAGYVFLIDGVPGSGKTTLASILPRLLYGAGIVRSGQVLDLRLHQPTGTESGVWFADDAHELFQNSDFVGQCGRAFLKANEADSGAAAMVLVGSEGFVNRLNHNRKALAWLMKCELHSFALPELTDDELVLVAENIVQEMGFTLDRRASAALVRMIGETRTKAKKGPADTQHFDGIGTVVFLLSAAKKAAIRKQRRTITADDLKIDDFE
jgi:hypothetical protein